MSETNGTGIIYPTITLGGIEYTLKFTRGALLYRLGKAGVNTDNLGGNLHNFSVGIDILRVIATPDIKMDAESLAELVLEEGKSVELASVISEAMGKAFPPTQQAAAGAAGTTAAVQ